MTDRLLYPRPSGSSGPNTTENNGNPASDTAYLNTDTLAPSGGITPPSSDGVRVEDGNGTEYPQEPIIQFTDSIVTDDPANTRTIVTIGVRGDNFDTNDIDNWVLIWNVTPATITPGVGMVFPGSGGSGAQADMGYIGAPGFINGTVYTTWANHAINAFQNLGIVFSYIGGLGEGQYLLIQYDGGIAQWGTNGGNIGSSLLAGNGNGLSVNKNGNTFTVTSFLDGVILGDCSFTLTGSNATKFGAGVVGQAGISGIENTCTYFQEIF